MPFSARRPRRWRLNEAVWPPRLGSVGSGLQKARGVAKTINALKDLAEDDLGRGYTGVIGILPLLSLKPWELYPLRSKKFTRKAHAYTRVRFIRSLDFLAAALPGPGRTERVNERVKRYTVNRPNVCARLADVAQCVIRQQTPKPKIENVRSKVADVLDRHHLISSHLY